MAKLSLPHQLLGSEYKPLQRIDDEQSDNEHPAGTCLHSRYTTSRSRCASSTVLVVFLLLTNLVSIVSILQLLHSGNTRLVLSKDIGNFETGFVTELAAARSHISIKRIGFTGGPTFNEDGSEYLQFPAGTPRYIGEPSQAIDDAWNALTAARYIFLTEDEAHDAWGSEYKEFYDIQQEGYVAGFETLHLLHCLDHIRQSFYPDRYDHVGIHGILHRDHCVDALRQMLQCTVDLTPIPTRYYAGIGQSYIDTDREHTCRDFTPIRAWITERFNGTSAVKVGRKHYL